MQRHPDDITSSHQAGSEIPKPDTPAETTALPFFQSKVSAGFPSPADDYLETKLDLNQYLIRYPASTFFVRVNGDSMIQAGIHHDDILVVDRSIPVSDGKVIIAVLNGEMTVKRFRKIHDKVFLYAENPAYPPLEVNEFTDFEVWGVVTSSIHKVV